MKQIELLTPERAIILDPTAETLKDCIVEQGDAYWGHGRFDAMITFRDTENFIDDSLYITLVLPRLFCVHFYGTALSTDLSDQRRVLMYDGQEWLPIQRSRLVDPQTALAAAEEFCRSGKRLKGFPWVLLNFLRTGQNEADLNDKFYDQDQNSDWD
jgi:hypothetical protein